MANDKDRIEIAINISQKMDNNKFLLTNHSATLITTIFLLDTVVFKNQHSHIVLPNTDLH